MISCYAIEEDRNLSKHLTELQKNYIIEALKEDKLVGYKPDFYTTLAKMTNSCVNIHFKNLVNREICKHIIR